MVSIKKEMKYLELLAKSWNNLDISFIEPVLSENVIYESQWILIPLTGKDSVMSFLISKFDSIKEAVLSNDMLILAETAQFTEANNRPCIVLTQAHDNEIRRVTVLIKIQSDRIQRIDVCFSPNPLTAVPTGKLPK
jgi:hypothetical protein